MTGGGQWLRKAGLVVMSDDGKGLELSALHFSFSVRQTDLQTPNNCDIRIHNLSEATMSRIGTEFSRLILQAGYEDGNFGIIFDGSIKQVRRGREMAGGKAAYAADSHVDILAADGDQGYNFAAVNQTLAAGSTARDHIEAVWTVLKSFGVAKGNLPEKLDEFKLARGKVMFGMARDYLRTAADSTGASWSIQNGQLNFLAQDGYLPGTAVVLDGGTGMIGRPEQTQDGIKVRCLLNPLLKIGGRVRIEAESIDRMGANLGYGAGDSARRIADDGYYRVLAVDHVGDIHGQNWYSDLICLALDDVLPLPEGEPDGKKVKSNG